MADLKVMIVFSGDLRPNPDAAEIALRRAGFTVTRLPAASRRSPAMAMVSVGISGDLPTGKPIGPKSRAPTRCEPPTVRDGRSCGTVGLKAVSNRRQRRDHARAAGRLKRATPREGRIILDDISAPLIDDRR